MANLNFILERIPNLILKNWDYFKQNPVHLTWACMHLRLASMAICLLSRQQYRITGKYMYSSSSVKDLIFDCEDSLTKEDFCLLDQADRCCVSNNCHFPDSRRYIPGDCKKNKTLDDWKNIFTHSKFKYNEDYSSEIVEYNLLFSDNPYYFWNKDGFIANQDDKSKFYGYTRAENKIRKDLRRKILAVSYYSLWKNFTKQIMRKVRINASGNIPLKNYINECWQIDVCENLSRSQKLKLKKAYKYLCYRDELINQAKKWTKEQWLEFEKQKSIKVNDYVLNINELRSDFYANASSFIFDLADSESIKTIKKDPRVNKIHYKQVSEKICCGFDAFKAFYRYKMNPPWKFYETENKEIIDKLSFNSNAFNFPKNAHKSYKTAIKKYCNKLIENSVSEKEIAERILEKLK
jgi:hypothetical protein